MGSVSRDGGSMRLSKILAWFLIMSVASPSFAAQDWVTRRSQPGVVFSMKAGERLIAPGAPGAAVWGVDTSTNGKGPIDYWAFGPAGQPNYYSYWVCGTLFPTQCPNAGLGHVESFDSLIGDTVTKSSGAASFRWTYPGAPKNEDEAFS